MVQNKQIKYWLLTTEYPPLYGGGISTYCLFTSKMLVKNGYAVTLFIPDNSIEDVYSNTENEIEIVRFNPARTPEAAALGKLAAVSFEFANIVQLWISKKGQPDIIEAQDYQGIAYYLQQFKYTLSKALSKVPIIITLHAPAFLYQEYNDIDTYRFPDFWIGEMEKDAINAADYLVSPSRFLLEKLTAYIPGLSNKTAVIANPYEAQKISGISKIQPHKVVYYGKLSRQKGTFELLSQFEQIWKTRSDIQLDLVGGTDIVYHPEGLTMGQIVQKKYAKFLKSGQLKLSGKINPAVLKEYIDDAAVVVVPSLIDNLPYVVMEMMEVGKIVLASKQGGQAEIIQDGFNGFLFDHERGDFCEKLLHVLNIHEEERCRISEQAIVSINEQFNPDQIFSEKNELIKKIIESKSTPGHFPLLFQENKKQHLNTAQNDLLTVVIPYFNMGKYVYEAIESIQNSSYNHIEILVINDGSYEPSSLETLNDLKTKNIRIIDKNNEGLAMARNEGANHARGRFLSFLDPDDKVHPDYYQKAIDILIKYDNVDFVGAWIKYFGESSQYYATYNPQPPYILVHNSVNSSSLVYNTSAFISSGLNDASFKFGLEDYDSVISLIKNGFNGIVIPEILFYYRVRKNSMFRKLNREKLVGAYRIISLKHAAYYNKFAAPVINLINSNGPAYLYDNPTKRFIPNKLERFLNKQIEITVTRVQKNQMLKKIALSIIKKLKN